MSSTTKNKITHSIYEWTDSILFSLAVVMLVFTFVIKTYTVQGSSMLPTFKSGDRVFAYSLFYEPKQGDVIIVDDTNNLKEPIIKRVAAVSGQSIEITADGTVLVDGQEFVVANTQKEYNVYGDTAYPLTVPDGYIFVMGDNRQVSLDSRYSALGFIDKDKVLGKEIFTIYSKETL